MTREELDSLVLEKSNILWHEMWAVYSNGGSLNTWLSTHRKEVEFVKDIKLLVESDKNAKKIMENYSYEEAKKNLVHPSHNRNLTVADFTG